ncbi:MAG TPA: ROK family protein [Pyrinomonadaceae bacterium]
MTSESLANKKHIGVEASLKNLRIAVLDDENVVSRLSIPLESEGALLTQLAAVLNELKQTAGEIGGVGVAVPGLVNRQTNRVILSTQIPTLRETDFAADLQQLTGLRTRLENDANAAAYAEFRLGAGRGSSSMFFATIGEGIGGSFIINGQIWRGAGGFAGEFGHIAIDEDGVRLEDVASAAGVVRRVKERLYHDSTSSLSRRQLEQAASVHDVVDAAKNGDDFAQMMLIRTGRYIGTAIATVINLLNPERIVVGGEVMEVERVILESIVRRANERSFRPSLETTGIYAAELSAEAAALGAALLLTNDF